MGHEARERQQQIRAARQDVMRRTADQLSKLLVELGPCHAVTIAFTMPAVEQENEQNTRVETHALSGWYDADLGSAHYAQVSDVMDRQHVELQKKLDQAEDEKRKAGAEGMDGPPGVVVEGHDD